MLLTAARRVLTQPSGGRSQRNPWDHVRHSDREPPIPVEQPGPRYRRVRIDAHRLDRRFGVRPWNDGDAVIDLIVEAVGPAPTPETTPKGDFYEWPEGDHRLPPGNVGLLSVTVAEVNGYEVRTVDGITVGSSRADVAALDIFPIDYDGDGDGLPDAWVSVPSKSPVRNRSPNPGPSARHTCW